MEASPEGLSSVFARRGEKREATCPEHGPYTAVNIIRDMWSGCPACAELRRAEEAAQEAERQRKAAAERHRAMLASAIACKPDILIADEPTTALDSTVQTQILALLQRLVAEEGMALILISHDLALVAKHVEQLAVLRHGQLLEQGRSQDIFQHPAHPYTRTLLAARAQLGQQLGQRHQLPAQDQS